MVYTTRITWEPLRTFDATTLTGSFQAIGTPLANPSYIFKMVNNSNALVTISFDGINDYDVLPPNSFFLYDETKNNQPVNALPQGTQILVRGTAATSAGLIYVVTQYLIHV